MQEKLHILDIGANGDGIARLEDGRTVFVPFSMGGDVVQAKLEEGGDVLRANIVSFDEKSTHRVVPPCRHFTICGGCSLQHLDDHSYRSFKTENVVGALAKNDVAVPENIQSIFIPAGTRRRANFAGIVTKGKTVIGFHERRSANVRDVPDCLIINDEVRSVMEQFRPYLADIAGEGKKMDVLIQCADGSREIALTGKIAPGWEAQQALSDAVRTIDLARISIRARDYEAYEILLDAKPLYKRFGVVDVNLALGAFLQPSAEGERALGDCVTGGAGDAARIADLFCGNGTFTGMLLEGRDIVAADLAPDAIAALKRAGADARVRNLFKDPMTAEELADRECVILDPPRAGALAQVATLAESAVEAIVYVSCNPQSFARDAAVLAGGGYALEKLTIVDQFVWSAHTELVAVFRR